MRSLTMSVVSFLKAEDGPTAVEYAVMLALILVVCLAAITTLGTSTNSTFSFVGSPVKPPTCPGRGASACRTRSADIRLLLDSPLRAGPNSEAVRGPLSGFPAPQSGYRAGLRYSQVRELADALKRPPHRLEPERVWQAFMAVEPAEVKGQGGKKLVGGT